MQPRALRDPVSRARPPARLRQPDAGRAPRRPGAPEPRRGLIRRHWLNALVVAAGAVAAVAVARAFIKQELQLREIRAEAAAIAQQLEQARARNGALKQEIVLLNTPAYIETVAREQLGLIKPGEIPYMIAQPEQTD